MNEKELKQNGFVFKSKGEMDNGESFKWWKLKIRDIAIYTSIRFYQN